MQFSFTRYFFLAIVLQLVFSELLTVNGFQPNIILLFIIISSISMENTSRATLIGFSIGLLSDLVIFSGSYLGLSSLVFSICAYLSAKVSFNFVYRNFDLYWLVLVSLGTGLYALFRYDFFFFNNIILFLKNWIFLATYTSFVGFIVTRFFKVQERVLEDA
tara:strand:+ start:2461 stop:2943 length:483 start_codon:yes stop_codon:yes gene_type:complete